MWRILIEAQKNYVYSFLRFSVLDFIWSVSLSPAVNAKEMYTHIISLQLAIAKFSRAVVASISKLPETCTERYHARSYLSFPVSRKKWVSSLMTTFLS